jgi:hypothetical protein
MSQNAVELLQAASKIVGGDKALANRLGVGPELLADFMAGLRELPDRLLLRAVDIILAERELTGSRGTRRTNSCVSGKRDNPTEPPHSLLGPPPSGGFFVDGACSSHFMGDRTAAGVHEDENKSKSADLTSYRSLE